MRIRLLPATIALGAVLVLAGCGTSAPTPTSTGSPSPSGEPAALVVPESVLPVSCGDILDLDARAELFGAPLFVIVDETIVSGVDGALARQAGALSCRWSTEATIGHAIDPGFAVIALPDAASEFSERLRPIVDEQYTTIDTAGDLSQFSCGYGACGFELLVDGYWLSGYLSATYDTPDDVMRAEAQAALDELVGVVRNTDAPRAAWTAPAGVAPGWGFCSDGDPLVTGIATALGVEGISTAGGGYESISGAIWERTGSGRCVAGNNDIWVALDFAPGGAWAFEHYATTLARPAFRGYQDGVAPDGTPVRWACAGPVPENACSVFAPVEGGLMNLNVSRFEAEVDIDAVLAAVPELAATIRGS